MKDLKSYVLPILIVVLIIIALTVLPLFGERIVELPLRVENVYSKRVIDPSGIFVAFYSPTGRLCLIPEDEISRFMKIAEEVDPDPWLIPFIPYRAAVGEYAVATLSLEFTGELRFWIDDESAFITWDEDHPAPIATVDGVEIVWSESPGLLKAPGIINIEQ